jgi:rod shape-determining protein MreC
MPWRVMAQRFSFVIFMGLALALIILGRAQPMALDHVRARAVDAVAPVVDALSRPAKAIANVIDEARNFLALREENAKLRGANAQLKEWQNAVTVLERENTQLKALLRFKPEPRLAYISARVIADTGGPFTRGLIVTAGKLDGVREGMAAMTGDGLIGRVVEAGDWSSRVILITDLNSRIPVTVASTGDRAILAGDNSAMPKLLYLPQDSLLATGAEVLTSGHGGVFPPNLPIGKVLEKSAGVYEVVPSANVGHIDYVRLVDFSLNGGHFNPLAARIDAENRKR